MTERRILVAGGGGFIGGHLAKELLNDPGNHVRIVDIKPTSQWYFVHDRAENVVGDLKDMRTATSTCDTIDDVYNLAADMGGMGFIENNKALCMLSVLINTNLLVASKESSVKRYFYASSACVYNADKQINENVTALKEQDAYPAMPEDGYGWEKLFSERMCRHFREDFGLYTRVARFHNVYGPHGTWEGGREKAPAAICRKVIEAVHNGSNSIEIWGNGKQTRSFMYIDDCIYGIRRIMDSDITEPINLGSNELVSINDLVDIVESLSNTSLTRKYNLNAPKGVNGRNSDNSLIQELLGWQPMTPLATGMRKTFDWILAEYNTKYAAPAAVS